MSTPLLRRPTALDAAGRIHEVTPVNAGWTYVGFELYVLPAGAVIASDTNDREVCLVLIAGKARASAGGRDFGTFGERNSVFDGLPHSLYVPAKSSFALAAETPVEVALCSAPGAGKFPPRVIGPDQVGLQTRGTGTNTRYVRNILAEGDDAAENLLIVEVITPGGNWSSYPPHKHDRDALPQESLLEEVYYHRLRPQQGFAFQRVYTDDRTLDETVCVHDGDVVLVRRGYHPVGAAHGYDLCYLNVMAGPKRTWRFWNDPAHAWMLQP